MSLRQKFFVILAMLSLILGALVGLSIWSIRFIERELAWPLRSAQPVLSGMHAVKRLGELQSEDLGVGRLEVAQLLEPNARMPDASAVAPRVIDSETRILRHLDDLEQVDSFRLRSGVSTVENLRRRSGKIMTSAEQWSSTSSIDDYVYLINQIGERHELIERIEGRIVDDAALVNTYGLRLRVLIFVIIAVGMLGSALVAAYSVLLLRRWVLKPVERLRIGAQHYAQGEFEHSIEVNTGDELGQLGDEFNHMASMIQSMQDERVERERLAAMGEMAQRTVHNLRTPLAGIRALAETTQSELEPDSDLREIQQRIIASVDRFEGWLQGMLRVSSPLQLHHRNYNPLRLVEAVVDSHKGAAESRSVSIELSVSETPPQDALGDPDQLEHALTALLSNAIDYAPTGTAVELTISVQDRDWTLRVRDHGPGIPKDMHVSIFRPYFTTRKDGTGIGLALVYRIVDQHRGSIEVQSPIDGDTGPGTAFVFQIPLDAQVEKIE